MNVRSSEVRLGKVRVSEELHKVYSNRWSVIRAQLVGDVRRMIRAQLVGGVRRMIRKPAFEISIRKYQGKRLLRNANHSPPVGR
jgi:hypothetical protein